MKEKDCIEKIKKGDEEALSYFIDHYAGLMKSVIQKSLWKYPYLIEEVLNDSVLSVWTNISYYDPKRSSFKNWCASVARYRAIDAFRKEARHESVNLNENLPHQEKAVEEWIFIEEILASLPPNDQRIFRQIFIEGYSYSETAQKNHLSLNALYSRISRGRKLLKKQRKESNNGC